VSKSILVFVACAVVACSHHAGETQLSNQEKLPVERIEYSTDTSFSSWDSLLLRYTYHPVNRQLSRFDKEWYVFHDSAELFCGYINMKGDTVIPMKYGYIPYVSDTFRHFAWVWLPARGLVAINKNEEVLFEPYYFDTAPDEDVIEGLIRIKRDKKVGFANKEGKIIIEPVYDEAGHFEKGYAWVGFNCYMDLLDDEHNPTICRQHGIINKKGELLYFSSNKDSISNIYKKLAGRND
jgi:hypothetical protein